MAQLVSINVCCRCVPARHALVCARTDGVPPKTTLSVTGQDSNAMFKNNAVSPFVSVARFKDALQPARTD
jgi:hypothetical protein